MANDRPINPLTNLYEIVNDFWKGTVPAMMAGTAEPAGAPAPAAQTAPAAQPAQDEQPKEIPFDEYWRRADESVDWTEVLTHAEPTDPAVTEDFWRFCHERAGRVLSGDVDAYAEVLREADPLKDMAPYARKIRSECASADEVIVSFEPLPERLDGDDLRGYLSGVALRCARDITALLPVRTVHVTALHGKKALLEVSYPRGAIRRARFGILDPVAFTLEQGGIFIL